MLTPIPHKNDNKFDPPAAIYLRLAWLAVNHWEVNQRNPDPLLFLLCLFDVGGSSVGGRHFSVAPFGFFDIVGSLFDVSGHVIAVNRSIHNKYSPCHNDYR
jgi:hypothetical protein